MQLHNHCVTIVINTSRAVSSTLSEAMSRDEQFTLGHAAMQTNIRAENRESPLPAPLSSPWTNQKLILLED